MVLICIEVIYGVFRFVKCFDLWHSELCWKREVQQPRCEWGFSLLHQSVHKDWSSAFYHFLYMVELLLDVPESLLPLLPHALLIRGWLIISVISIRHSFIEIFSSRGNVGTTPPSSAGFSCSISFLRRVEGLLFFLGDGVTAFLGLSYLLGVLYLSSELLQLSQQKLVDETECLHLVGIGVYGF